jgi:hypothetical protein
VQRRRFIAGAASLAALSAGCLSAAPTGDTATTRARLDELWFVNDSDEAVDASVTVEDGDGAQVFEASFTLGAAGGDGAASSNATCDPELSAPSEYVVRATVAGDTASIDTSKWASSGENCVTAKFVRTTRGTLRARPQTYERC